VTRGITQADRKALAVNLLRLRRDAGLTQDQLADKALLDPSTISRLESGKVWPKGLTALLLCRALGVSLRTLCGEAFWTATHEVDS
jgi:transcriptional regulator with XRE-family HTH domain